MQEQYKNRKLQIDNPRTWMQRPNKVLVTKFTAD